MENVAFITEILNGGMNLVLAVAVYFLWTKLNKKEEDADTERKEMQTAFDGQRKTLHTEHREDMERLGEKLDKLNERACKIAEAFDALEALSEDGS